MALLWPNGACDIKVNYSSSVGSVVSGVASVFPCFFFCINTIPAATAPPTRTMPITAKIIQLPPCFSEGFVVSGGVVSVFSTVSSVLSAALSVDSPGTSSVGSSGV